MQTQDEKLEKFLNAINEYSQKQRAQILLDIETQMSAELQQAESETQSDVYRVVQQRTADVRQRARQEVSRFEQDSRRELLKKRCKLEEMVMKEAADKLAAFTKTEGYPVYLAAAAKKAAEYFSSAPEETVFFLRPEDMRHADAVRKAYGSSCKVKEDGGISIGGLRAVNSALSAAEDATLSARLEEQRQWLLEHSGMELSGISE